jgi:hypothetical protein
MNNITVNNNRVQKNFWDSLEIGEKAEKELAAIIKKRMAGCQDIVKVDYQKFGFDLFLTFVKNGIVRTNNLEVKDLAGGYPTGVVEQWADDAKTKRPHWWKMGNCDYIFFKDESRNLWFMYDADKVINFLKNYKGRLSRARNGNKDDSGWLAFFYWDPNNLPFNHNPDYVMDGWLMTFKGA